MLYDARESLHAPPRRAQAGPDGLFREAARLLGITRIMMKRRVDRLMAGAGKDED
ncbi:hypothetical protein [Polyangium sp. 15x6]|uniref:hypothetical protein n=1 Tax=Polyangium sp. 15x6 TaxID=3042687 RepID=UPI00249BB892|nr:hypothetical protein [Polyangium sp. 15x6]MDI3287010.1 hypothetical protein [Polyangium sp. 15x6]